MLKRIFLIGLIVLCMSILAYGAVNVFTQSIDARNTIRGGYAWTGHIPKDKAWIWAKEVEDRLDGTTANQSFYFGPTDTVPTATEGRLYYNNTTSALTLYTGSEWATLEKGGEFASLDEAYNGGAGVTVDGTAITLTTGASDDNGTLIIACNESANDPCAVVIVMGTGSTGTALHINSQSTGTDIAGDNWSASQAGIGTFAGIIVGGTDIVLENGEKIVNSTNDVILFDTGAEDLSIDFTTGDNIITLGANSTGATSIDVGDYVTLTQLRNLIFEAAGAGVISLAGTTNDWDLTILQSGTVDSSLILSSAGSITDALSLITSDSVGVMKMASAYKIDIDAVDMINIDISGAAKDFDVDSDAGSISLDGGEAADNAITLVSAAGGLDGSFAKSIKFATTESETDSINFDSAGGIDFDISGGAATEDFSVTTDTSITMTATENAAENIHIEENGGTAATINIYSNQGITASATAEHDASIQLHSDDGGIGLYSGGNVADAIRIETDGGSGATLHIQAIKGTGASAKGENDASIQLESTVGGIGLYSALNGADAVRIETVGGSSATINILADEGTAFADGAASIQLLSDDGAIGLKATTSVQVGEKASAIQLTALVGAIELYSGLNATNAIKLTADGGTNSDIVIFNDTGNTTDSIQLLTDLGGITLTATKAFKIEASVCLNDTQTMGESDATPDVGGFSFFDTHTTTDTIDDFDGTDIEEGQIIVVISQGAITYDVTAGALICGTTDLITANGDVTMWIYDGTNWQLISWMDDAVDQNGRG